MAQVKQIRLRRDPSLAAYAVVREHLIAARKLAGMTQLEVADRVGKPQSFIAKVERGERYLDVVEFSVIAGVIGMDIWPTMQAIMLDPN